MTVTFPPSRRRQAMRSTAIEDGLPAQPDLTFCANKQVEQLDHSALSAQWLHREEVEIAIAVGIALGKTEMTDGQTGATGDVVNERVTVAPVRHGEDSPVLQRRLMECSGDAQINGL